MEMSEEIYQNVEVAADNRAGSRDSEQSYEDVYVNEDNLQTQRARSFKQSESSVTGNNPAEKKSYKLTTVCLLLLCFLLLTSLTIMWIKFSILNSEKAKLETSHKNLTKEKDQLQTSYKTLTKDKDQLQTRYNNLSKEKDQLQTNYNTLTKDKDQLYTSFNTLTKEKSELQTSYKNLNIEKDKLQTSYNTLTKEKSELQTSYTTLTKEKSELRTSYNTLIKERDQLKNQNDEFQKTLTGLGWTLFQSKLYYISTEKKNWAESREDCKKRGADLVIINNAEEQTFVEGLNKKHGNYIGLSDLDKEGTWKWVDGTLLNTSYWSSGNVFSDSEDCVVNWYGGSTRWYDRPCSETYYWIYE